MRADSRHRLSLRSRAPRPGTVWHTDSAVNLLAPVRIEITLAVPIAPIMDSPERLAAASRRNRDRAGSDRKRPRDPETKK